MLDILLNKQIFVQNSFYGLITPTVTSVEINSKDENYCKIKIFATLENIKEYFIEINKMNNIEKNQKSILFTNFKIKQENPNYELSLKKRYFLIHNNYSYTIRTKNIDSIVFKTEIEIYRKENQIEFDHNTSNEFNQTNSFQKCVPGLSDEILFDKKIIKSQFSLYYNPYNMGNAKLVTTKKISMDSIIQDLFFTLTYEKKSEYFFNSTCFILDNENHINVSSYISKYFKELEDCLNSSSSFFNNYEYQYFENSLSKLNRIKTNFVAKEIFDLIASSKLLKIQEY